MKIIIDNKIPFIHGRLEPYADVIYLPPSDIRSENISYADALIIRTRTRCDSSLLQGSRVKAIATATIGTDHIDLPWCARNGIKVFNSAGCNAPGVADYVWASLLLNGFDPSEHTLGIIGYGNIGKIVARVGKALGCNILINDPPLQDIYSEDSIFCSLDNLLKNSDAVTVHTPLSLDGLYPTFHLIGDKELDMMHEGVILINAARGGIIDEDALGAAIDKKKIRAILDVWENEPYINGKVLNRVFPSTPHIAGYSLQGKVCAADMAVNAIAGFFDFPLPEPLLEGEWTAPESLSLQELKNLLVPVSTKLREDSKALQENPDSFESLRENYNYRNEVLRGFQRV